MSPRESKPVGKGSNRSPRPSSSRGGASSGSVGKQEPQRGGASSGRPPRPESQRSGGSVTPSRGSKPVGRKSLADDVRDRKPRTDERRGHKDTDPPEIKRWVDYPNPKYKDGGAAESEPAKSARTPLRVKKSQRSDTRAAAGGGDAPRRSREHPARRRRRRETEAMDELMRLAGPNRNKALNQLRKAADLFAGGLEREALKVVNPLANSYPDAAGVQELVGLCHYRVGQYPSARKALESFVTLSNSTEQHPVLMDCLRALGKHNRVETLWAELAQASPSAELVTEGRIVMAGSLADRGKLEAAITLLEKRSSAPKRLHEYHLRLWYALGDLHDRSGNTPAARHWFDAVASRNRSFFDVAERLAALGR